MTDDQLELEILKRYVEHHDSVGTEADKCERELDMRQVISSITGTPTDDETVKRWHARLAPPRPYKQGILRPCSRSNLNTGPHKFHARAFYEPGLTPAWDRIRELEKQRPAPLPTEKEKEQQKMVKSQIRLFISHSSRDSEFVETLIELLRSALSLPSSQIRCTSIDGYRLPGGANTDQQLRQEVHDADTFIGVISLHSINSLYVVFELGARWGAGRSLIPLIAPGTDSNILSGPLAGINAVNAGNRPQIHQLISDLATQLDVSAESPAAYERYIEPILKIEYENSENDSIMQEANDLGQLQDNTFKIKSALRPSRLKARNETDNFLHFCSTHWTNYLQNTVQGARELMDRRDKFKNAIEAEGDLAIPEFVDNINTISTNAAKLQRLLDRYREGDDRDDIEDLIDWFSDQRIKNKELFKAHLDLTT